ncbi:MAG: nucleotide exchange factor GrpE [Salibacteraceae bacterium]
MSKEKEELNEEHVENATHEQQSESAVDENQGETGPETTDSSSEQPELDPMEQMKKDLEEEKNKYLRLYAEFENFRRRNAKERIELIGSASGDLIKEMLPVLDDFYRAIESNKKLDDIEAVKEGFVLLQQKLTKTLQAKGLQPIESKGEPFDAELHEAVAQVPVEKAKEKGIIIDEVEKGYKLNEKILRHPKVVVGS